MATKNNQITIAGEIFSSNLGDGVIADSLAYLIHQVAPSFSTGFIDISGNTDWRVDRTIRTKPSHSIFPPKVETYIRWQLKRKNRNLRVWRNRMKQTSKLIIGGGQLLMDNDLDFPLKIHALVREAMQQQLPVHFVACGVNPNWSPIAANMFRESLLNAESISVRDIESAESLRALVPTINPFVVFDPAIWAAEVYGLGQIKQSANKIGVGVIDPTSANRRSATQLTESDFIAIWKDIILLLANMGFEVEIFTNGNPSDYAIALKISEIINAEATIECPVAARPTRPIDLAHRISSYSGVIAARLHACIISTSYLIPVVGLAWDKKVNSFFRALGKSALSINLTETCSPKVIAAFEEAKNSRLDPSSLAEYKASASSAINYLLAASR